MNLNTVNYTDVNHISTRPNLLLEKIKSIPKAVEEPCNKVKLYTSGELNIEIQITDEDEFEPIQIGDLWMNRLEYQFLLNTLISIGIDRYNKLSISYVTNHFKRIAGYTVTYTFTQSTTR